MHAKQAANTDVELRDAAELRETAEWLARMLHQSQKHEGDVEECRNSICATAQALLGKARGEQ